jgi:phage-related protein
MKPEWKVVFYASEDGRDSVFKEIDGFGENNAVKIFKTVELLKTYGHSVLETHIKHINRKIWEIKIDHYRVLYFMHRNQHYVLVRAFMKKTQKTPEGEVEIAEKRYGDYLRRAEGA